MSVPGSMRPDTTLSKDAKTDDVRLWLGETSVGKKRPSASAVDAAVGSLQKVSISFQGGDGTGKTGAASRRGSLDRSAGAHHPNGDDVDNTDVTDDEDEADGTRRSRICQLSHVCAAIFKLEPPKVQTRQKAFYKT